jgi:hypothetical protein
VHLYKRLPEENPMTELMCSVFFMYCASTWAMVGVIWFAQIVHYPLFSKVGPESFTDYQHANLRRTVFVVIPLQMIELATALLLVWKTPTGILPVQVWTNLVLIGITWVSTATLQVPSHSKLARGFNPRTQSLADAISPCFQQLDSNGYLEYTGYNCSLDVIHRNPVLIAELKENKKDWSGAIVF